FLHDTGKDTGGYTGYDCVRDELHRYRWVEISHHQGQTNQVRGHSRLYPMADHLARIAMLHPSQIQPPFRGGHIGHVGVPALVRLRGGKRLHQQVVRPGSPCWARRISSSKEADTFLAWTIKTYFLTNAGKVTANAVKENR